MKNLFITTLMAVVMAIFAVFTCVAQEHVVATYDRFVQFLDTDNSIATMSKNVEYRDKESGDFTGACQVRGFYLPSNMYYLIKDLTHAMSQDNDVAYHSASSSAGNRGVNYAIAYGSGKNDFEMIGADNDMNFMVVCFKDDTRDNDYRTSYAIEWKQNNDGYYTGKIYKIFGQKPDDSNRFKIWKSGDNNDVRVYIDSLVDLSGLKNLESFKELEALKGLESLKDLKLLEGLENKLGDIYNFKVYTNRSNNKDMDNSDWLTTFAMYCNKFKEKAKQSPSKGAVYATELLQMCKRADGVITASEKKLCIKNLKECQKSTNDTFVVGLLDEAINWLSGKNKAQSNNINERKMSVMEWWS